MPAWFNSFLRGSPTPSDNCLIYTLNAFTWTSSLYPGQKNGTFWLLRLSIKVMCVIAKKIREKFAGLLKSFLSICTMTCLFNPTIPSLLFLYKTLEKNSLNAFITSDWGHMWVKKSISTAVLYDLPGYQIYSWVLRLPQLRHNSVKPLSNSLELTFWALIPNTEFWIFLRNLWTTLPIVELFWKCSRNLKNTEKGLFLRRIYLF